MKNRQHVLVLVILLAAYCNPLQSEAQNNARKYNVIFISTHDMTDRISILGKDGPATPNFERLAAHGIVFYNNYVQYPLSSPGRTCLLSGWRPDKTGVFINSVRPRSLMGNEVRFLPEYFHDFGYRTERYGTVMLYTWESDISWDYAEPLQTGVPVARPDKPVKTAAEYEGGDWWIDERPDTATDQATLTKHYINRLQQPEDQPFFYALGYVQTHNPFTPSIENWNKTGDPMAPEHLPDRKGDTTQFTGNGSGYVVLPQTPPGDRDDVPPVAFGRDQILKTEEEWRKTIHAYDGDLAQLDTYLGWVLDELDRQNLWDNSIVIFWVDHGQHLGEHEGTWLKGTVFDESLHVPLIICVPGKQPGVCYRLTENVDVYATLAELCGLPPPPGMEGHSLAPLMDNPAFTWKRAVFGQTKRPDVMGRTVLTEQYRYTSWDNFGEELYDLMNDRDEYTNLAGIPAYNDALSNMRTILADGWQASAPPAYPLLTFYKDQDSDGSGSLTDSLLAYALPQGYAINSGDCNDANATVFPGAPEICDGIDNNCNTYKDENLPRPVIMAQGNTEICIPGSVILATNKVAGFKYTWKKNNVIIGNATKRTYTATEAGTYTVTMYNQAGCSRTSKGMVVTDSCSRLAAASLSALHEQSASTTACVIYPNPANTKTQVTFFSSVNELAGIYLFDINGRQLKQKTIYAIKGQNTIDFEIGFLPEGVYFIGLQQQGKMTRSSIVISR